jgi:UDP-N-acetylmuramoyl-tripeptide--D-alanyl-D-alanine ligase
LQRKFKTVATLGNLNNHIGVPLTLLSFTNDTQFGIVEMGANHQQEIAFLCRLANPDFGYITNFGKAHLEGFGGVEGVIKGKSEMFDFLFESGKMAFINLDDPIQADKSKLHPRFTFGCNSSDADIKISSIEANPFVNIVFDGGVVRSQLIGHYNATNICAAIAVGRYFKVPDDEIIAALESYAPQNNRSQLLNKNEHRLILDAYNANPSSMAAALEHFKSVIAPNKVAILGDMFELGAAATAEHTIMAQMAAQLSDITIYLVGKEFYSCRLEAPNLHYFENFDTLAQHLLHFSLPPSTILIKGSRGMALERTLDYL